MNTKDFCHLNDLDLDFKEDKIESLLETFACALNHIFDGEPLDGDQTEQVGQLVHSYLDMWNGNNDQE